MAALQITCTNSCVTQLHTFSASPRLNLRTVLSSNRYNAPGRCHSVGTLSLSHLQGRNPACLQIFFTLMHTCEVL